MTSKLNILFPVETINRELDFRLFLAALAVNKNRRIFVGQHNVVDNLVKRMNGGIYLGKHIFKDIFPRVNIEYYEELKKRQFKLIHLDEEGAVYPGNEEQWKKSLRVQLNPNYFTEDDYVCSWGKFQANFYKSREPACKENIYATGHPRFDLYKPEYNDFFANETNKIKEKYGDFVLINTNLTFANNGLGMKDTFSLRNNYDLTNLQERTDYLETWSHTSKILVNIINLINKLSIKFPELNFLVRPHPTEDWSFYETIFEGFENVLVVHEGPVTPWILACRLLLHDGCTTGIEAFLGGKSVIAYKSRPDEKHDFFLPDNVGMICTDDEDVIENIGKVLSGENICKTEDLNPLIFDLMANFKEDCFQNMLEVIKKAEEDLSNEQIKSNWNENQFFKDEKLRIAKNKAKSIIRPLFKAKYERYRFLRENHFYGFVDEKIKDKLNRIKNVLQKDFKYTFHSEDLISIENK